MCLNVCLSARIPQQETQLSRAERSRYIMSVKILLAAVQLYKITRCNEGH